jgi:TonB family protein
MAHGVESFFVERRRAGRRTATIAAALSAVLLSMLLASAFSPFKQRLNRFLSRSSRFGYEGPDQFVRRITLQQFQGRSSVLRNVGAVDTRAARPGGAVKARPSTDPMAQPETGPRLVGTGLSTDELVARAVSRLANVPVVQSEDLIIQHSAQPVYPQSEADRGIEGRVMVQALVDTAGRVVEVQLLASTGIQPFERSAQEAVWQFRFRPYRAAGTASEVYAIFTFAFRVY